MLFNQMPIINSWPLAQNLQTFYAIVLTYFSSENLNSHSRKHLLSGQRQEKLQQNTIALSNCIIFTTVAKIFLMPLLHNWLKSSLKQYQLLIFIISIYNVLLFPKQVVKLQSIKLYCTYDTKEFCCHVSWFEAA